MLFLTIWFLFTNLYGLFKGKMFYSILLESAEFEIKKSRGELDKIPKETASKVGLVIGYMTIYTIVQFIYIIKALYIDSYLLPTIAVMLFIFSGFISLPDAKNDLTNEIGRAKYLNKVLKRYSLRWIITKVFYIVYFGYMFAVLLNLI